MGLEGWTGSVSSGFVASELELVLKGSDDRALGLAYTADLSGTKTLKHPKPKNPKP